MVKGSFRNQDSEKNTLFFGRIHQKQVIAFLKLKLKYSSDGLCTLPPKLGEEPNGTKHQQEFRFS